MPLELEEVIGTEEETVRPAVRRTNRARSIRMAALGAGAVAIVAAGTGLYLHYQNRVSTDDAQVDAHNAPVAPKISGNIVEVLVDDNQMVKAGQPLVRIDARDYQARVDQARAALAVAESQSAGAYAGVPLAEGSTAGAVAAADSQLAAAAAEYARSKADYERASTSELAYAQADVESKRATRDRAQADLGRMQPLVAKDEISKQQFDSYLATARVAESDLKAAQENLVNARGKAETEIRRPACSNCFSRSTPRPTSRIKPWRPANGCWRSTRATPARRSNA